MSDSPVVQFDTLKKKEIVTRINWMTQEIRSKGKQQKLAYPKFHPGDTLRYVILEPNTFYLMMSMTPPQEIVWPTFYVYDGELILVRYRYMSEKPNEQKAFESFIYLDHGNIVYCEEHGRPLAPDEPPASVRRLPFEPSTRTLEEIQGLYIEHWQNVLQYMKEHEVLPDFLEHYLDQ